jgi:hypothetical protein
VPKPLTDEEIVEVSTLLNLGENRTEDEEKRKNHLIAKFNLVMAMNDLVDIFHERRKTVATRW